MKIDLAEMIKCVNREIALRKIVYPKRVADDKMTQQQADHEIACMVEIGSLLCRMTNT